LFVEEEEEEEEEEELRDEMPGVGCANLNKKALQLVWVT
jgi:hypothetical protein